MAKNREKLAELLGAKIIGDVPDVGGGAFGVARLAHILHQRLTPSQGERPGRPTNPNWAMRPKVPMSEMTFHHLAEIADAMSTPDRKISPMQVAAQMLEEAAMQAWMKMNTPIEEIPRKSEDSMAANGTKISREIMSKRRGNGQSKIVRKRTKT